MALASDGNYMKRSTGMTNFRWTVVVLLFFAITHTNCCAADVDIVATIQLSAMDDDCSQKM